MLWGDLYLYLCIYLYLETVSDFNWAQILQVQQSGRARFLVFEETLERG